MEGEKRRERKVGVKREKEESQKRLDRSILSCISSISGLELPLPPKGNGSIGVRMWAMDGREITCGWDPKVVSAGALGNEITGVRDAGEAGAKRGVEGERDRERE